MFSLPIPLLLLLWPTVAVFATSTLQSSPFSSPISASPSASSTSFSGSVTATSSSSAAPSSSTTSFPDLGNYSPCVSNCLDLSISQLGCNSIVDVDCYCHNATRFVHDILTCVTPQCNGDLASAENVTQLFCNIASPNVSLSYPPLPSTSTASSTVLSGSSLPSSSQPSQSSSLSSSTSPPSASASASQTSGSTHPTRGSPTAMLALAACFVAATTFILDS
ncbi:hypothetical protein BC835DRAFT_84783 [Cytidiella melzeri]|nr:hypothetical protein BC835DRAFT_84783 [Cytidiella melzeri]